MSYIVNNYSDAGTGDFGVLTTHVTLPWFFLGDTVTVSKTCLHLYRLSPLVVTYDHEVAGTPRCGGIGIIVRFLHTGSFIFRVYLFNHVILLFSW